MTGIILSLETDRLILRRIARRDWEPCRDYLMSDRSIGIGGPDTLAVAWRAFATMLGQWEIHGFGMWTVTVKGDDTGIGAVGAWFPADWPEKEIGWSIWSESVEGKGYAFEAANAVISHAFHTLGWSTAVSYIRKDNARSIALAERLGATLDPEAAQPRPEKPCLVYRHPKPRKIRI